MNTLWKTVKHNYLVLAGIVICGVLLLVGLGCESKVASLVDSDRLLTRNELSLEIDRIVATAEIRVAELDKQDEFKQALFNIGLNLAAGGTINPVGVVLTLGTILGVGAAGDNTGAGTTYLFDGSTGNLLLTFTNPTPGIFAYLPYFCIACHTHCRPCLPFLALYFARPVAISTFILSCYNPLWCLEVQPVLIGYVVFRVFRYQLLIRR